MSALWEKPRRRPELNLVPLIDVLVMLIFFAFVTMQFRAMTTFNITLPKVTSAGKNSFSGKVEIAIDKSEKIAFNGQVVTRDELVAALTKVAAVNSETAIMIKADKSSDVGTFSFVMDQCRILGLASIHMETQ